MIDYIYSYSKFFILVVFATFFVFLFESYDYTISYDLGHYFNFIIELNSKTFYEFLEKFYSFPYYSWADYGRFEFGFAILAYIFTGIFGVSWAYPVMATVSIIGKVYFLYKLKVNIFLIALFVVFSISLFEVNALRAGYAVLFILGALYFYLSSRYFISMILCFLAIIFHFSALFFVLVCLVAYSYKLIPFKKGVLLIFSVIAFFVILNLDFFMILLGGKFYEYYVQANYYNMYTGASGFNIVSLILFFTLIISIFSNVNFNLIGGFSSNYLYFKYFINFCALFLFLLVAFSGKYSVISDRIWQMFFPLVLVFFSHIKLSYFKPRVKFFNTFLTNTIVATIFMLFLSYYIVVINIFVYPQSNVFSFLTGYRDLMLPQVY